MQLQVGESYTRFFFNKQLRVSVSTEVACFFIKIQYSSRLNFTLFIPGIKLKNTKEISKNSRRNNKIIRIIRSFSQRKLKMHYHRRFDI